MPEATMAPDASFTVRLGMRTAEVPAPTAWKIMVTRTPEPETPALPGRRLRVMAAMPVSFWMFLVNTGIWPSLEKKSPLPTSLSLRTLGSNWIVRGADTTSAAFSMIRATVVDEPLVVLTTGGRKWMDAEPVTLPGSAAEGAAVGGVAGAVAGGAAVSGGAVAGGRPGPAGCG